MRFFRRSLAQYRGIAPDERRRFRQRIYATIEAIAQGPVSVEEMCQAAGVSRAGFYRDWQERKPQEAGVAIRDAVQKAALRYRRYGYRRITELVRRSGIAVGEWVVLAHLRMDDYWPYANASSWLRRIQTSFCRLSESRAVCVPERDQSTVGVRHHVCAAGARVRISGGGARRLFAPSGGLVTRPDFANQLGSGSIESRHHQPTAGYRSGADSDRGSQYASDDYVRRLEEATC